MSRLRRLTLILILTGFWLSLATTAGYAYKIKEFKPKPAKEYAAFQDFQNIVIAASPRYNDESVLELFDTTKLIEKQIMPVVVIVQNNNDFAIRMHDQGIFLVDKDGARISTIPFHKVLLTINLKKDLGSYSGRPEVLLRQIKDKKMLEDFEHKAFGDKMIAPHDSDYGVVFFPLPPNGDLSGTQLYIPEVRNVSSGEPLMFFEFELAKAK